MNRFKLKTGGMLITDGHEAYVEGCEKPEENVVLDAQVVKMMEDGVFDADGAVFFQRELEFVKSKSYDTLYAELKARQLFPVSNDGGKGVASITYRTYDTVAAAKIINAYADDLPRADVAGKETTIPVRSVGTSFGYNIDELDASVLTGRSLDQRRANAGRRSIEETVNRVAFFGDAEAGLPGLFTNANIPTGSVVNPGAGTEWVNKTPAEILFDLNDAFADIFETTNMVESGDTVMLPPAQWSLIMSTPRSDNSDTTIGQYLASNSPYINSVDDIIPVNECLAANNPEYANDVMVVYHRDPDKLQLEIPVELEWRPVQEKGLEFVVPGRMRLGGLNIYYPLSLNILEGI